MPSGNVAPVTQQPPLRSTWLDINLQVLLRIVAVAHVVVAPYTKVEESFNVQAVHDWLFLGLGRINEWDHILFPGAVPRSFIPSLLLSLLSYPFLLLGRFAGFITTSADAQLLVRCILALCWAEAALFFARRVAEALDLRAFTQGDSVRERKLRSWLHRLTLIFHLVQFRIPFYAGRPLPNGFAMPLVLVALGLALPRGLPHEKQQLAGIALLIFTSLVIRLECLALVGALGLYHLHSRLFSYRSEWDPHPVESIAKLAGISQAAATLSAGWTALMDRWMWRVGMDTNWTWPELEAGLFNVVQGKSVEWGIEPWSFYVTSALPGLLLGLTPLAVGGAGAAVWTALRGASQSASGPPATSNTLQQGRSAPSPAAARSKRINEVLAQREAGQIPPLALLWVSAVQVGLLSLLKHKEWRFIVYVGPCLNVLAALAAALWLFPATKLGSSSSSSPVLLLRRLLPLTLTLLTLALTLLGLGTSSSNYPGGEALRWLHETHPATSGARVHIDVAPAMTGVSLFQSLHHSSHHNSRGAFGLSFLPGVLPPSTAEERAVWTYDKQENLDRSLLEIWGEFDWVISEVPCDQVVEGREGKEGFVKEASFSEHAGLSIVRRPTIAAIRAIQGKGATRRRNLVDYIDEVLLPRLPIVAGYRLALVSTTPLEQGAEGLPVRTESLALIRSARGKKGGDEVQVVAAFGVKRRERVWVCRRVA